MWMMPLLVNQKSDYDDYDATSNIVKLLSGDFSSFQMPKYLFQLQTKPHCHILDTAI